MKVLQVIGSLGTGGAEKLLLDTIPLYRERGIEMDIVIFWNNNHQFVNALKEMNCCNIIIFNESNNYKDIYSLSNIIKLGKVMSNYDIAHIHLFPAQYFAVLAKKFYRLDIKLLFTEHNTSNRRIESVFGRIVDRFFYKKYDHLVFISKEIEDIFYKAYPKIQDSSVIQNGINLQNVYNCREINWCSIDENIAERKVVLQVSAFRKQKDQKTLIKSLNYLPNEYVVVLVGDGETRNECESFVNELQLNDRVFFLGQRMDVFKLLKSADCVVLSSLYEGLSLSSIEGMASGRPFIASDVPGLKEIVEGYGVLFPSGNDKELAERILELRDTEYSISVIKKCLERAQEFDINIMVNKHIDLYTSLVNKKGDEN